MDLRSPTPRERVESRQVPRDGYVSVGANRYTVPLPWAGESGADPVRHARLTGKHQVARWEGPARTVPRRPAEPAAGPPRFGPAYVERIGEVEIRPLARGGALVSGGAVQSDRLQWFAD